MKRILFFLLLLISFQSFGQLVQFPNTTGIGYKRTGGDVLLWVPSDTLTPPEYLASRSHLAVKGSALYYWSGTKWNAAGGGSTPTWQQTLTAGSTLTGANTIDGGGFGLLFNNTGRFRVIRSGNTLIDLSSSSSALKSPDGAYAVELFPSPALPVFHGITNSISTPDRIVVQNSSEEIGYATLGAGLSLSAGVLNTSGTVATPISSLTNSAATNSITVAHSQTWGFSNTTGNTSSSGMVENYNSLTTGTGRYISSTSNGNGYKLLHINASGGTNSGVNTDYGLYVNMSTSAITAARVGIYSSVTGGAFNHAIIVPASGGYVGIGNSNPSDILSVGSSSQFTVNTSGEFTMSGSGAIGTIGGGATAARLRFLEPSGSGSNYTSFKAQAQSANIDYVLPATGASGVLTNDGSNNLSWAASGGAFWALTGTSSLTGNVLIDGSGNDVAIQANSGSKIALGSVISIGDPDVVGNGSTFVADDVNSRFTFDNTSHTASVGINTSTPGVALDVKGDILFNTTVSETAFQILADDANIGVPLRINNGDKWILFDPNGDGYKMGIGTNSPDATLEVVGDFTTSGVNTLSDLAGTGSRAVLADASGVLSAPVSDRSTKENIKDLKGAIGKVMSLRPVSFEYRDGFKNYGKGTQVGFIAQDIQKILPNSVYLNNSNQKMGYNEIDLVPLLVSAVQEQQKMINELNKRIQKLEKK